MLRRAYGQASVLDVLDELYTPELTDQRRDHAHKAAHAFRQREMHWRQNVHLQCTYGEFDLDLFTLLLDRASVQEGDTFVDLGSGAGRLVLAAALLKPQVWERCAGVELLELLHKQAEGSARKLRELVSALAPVEFLLADLFDPLNPRVTELLSSASVVVAYAITWARDENGRLVTLSNLLGATLKDGARVIVVDAKLIDTPRVEFEHIGSDEGWNEDTGLVRGHVFRVRVRCETV